MSSRLLATAVAGLTVLGLAACGPGNGPTPMASVAATAASSGPQNSPSNARWADGPAPDDGPAPPRSPGSAATHTAHPAPRHATRTMPVSAEQPAAVPPAAPPPSGRLATVTAVVPLLASAPPSGVGAVTGGVLGAVLGHQVGGGDGRKVATVLGAVGGAVLGNKVEQQRGTHVTGYRVELRLDDGSSTALTEHEPTVAIGQRVRLLDGRLLPA